MSDEREKNNLSKAEEKILEFWEKNSIFQKTLDKNKNKKRFVFYDGPPFATGLPHYGHILASTVKDVVPRFWTMRGFRVDRRWGWDCHGLPIEHLVEQELNISGRKEIEGFGIKKFNETARSKVLLFTAEWFKTVRRIGRFVDFEHAYTTMDPTYMESVWWAFATLYKKGLIYKDARTSLFCPRCETPLSNFEIAMDNSYRDQEDDSVYVKLPILGKQNEFLLIWTTTPWTLPGNAAVAVNPKLEYIKFKVGKEFLWAATRPPYEVEDGISIIEKRSGKSLIGLKYKPLFSLADDKNVYRVVGADFVGAEEGTGLVHIAPAFGEEDFLLGKVEHLPIFAVLDDTGRFTSEYSLISFLKGKKAEEANQVIIKWLKEQNALWKIEKVVHRYPICWRCQTPLIYKVQPAWFVNIAELKPKLLALNENIDWHPEHLKRGRFGNGLEMAPDWNVSRSRFWGTPIPIWECEKCKKNFVVESREEFHKHSAPARNTYFIMRHGEAVNNKKEEINSAWPDVKKFPLTLRGKTTAAKLAAKLKKEKIDLIVASDFARTRETAEIVGRVLGIKTIHFEPRLREVKEGVLEGLPYSAYHNFFSFLEERFFKKVPGGETIPELRTRVFAALADLEKKYIGKKILIVSHEHPLWALFSSAQGLSKNEMIKLRGDQEFIDYAEIKRMEYKHVPRNDTGEIDFHRPYIDLATLYCKGCGAKAKRVPDVLDCWFESGSMPIAEKHYPFENKKLFEENFPADFIAEYIAQTRGWFYTLHVLAGALFAKPAFKHVVTTGTILSAKGEKLSKSRKNFPDPWLLFERYGVDAIRFYLMFSPVMRAENINFSEKDVDEIYKKFSLISLNVLNLFKLYSHRLKRGAPKGVFSRHILDRWIRSRLHSTIKEVTDAFQTFKIMDAARPLYDFMQDLSLWYVRRSRDRFKSEDAKGVLALATLYAVLLDFSRLIAPLTPFLAEIIYQGLEKKKPLSVHLEDWPAFEKRFSNADLEQDMLMVRGLASKALRARAEAGIKVRQPLASLEIPDLQFRTKEKAALLDILKAEVNVKKVVFGQTIKLDTVITPELKEEGLLREFIRHVQEMRRDAGLKPKDMIVVQVQGVLGAENLIIKHQDLLKKEIRAKEIKIGGKKIFKIERELDWAGQLLWVGLSGY